MNFDALMYVLFLMQVLYERFCLWHFVIVQRSCAPNEIDVKGTKFRQMEAKHDRVYSTAVKGVIAFTMLLAVVP